MANTRLIVEMIRTLPVLRGFYVDMAWDMFDSKIHMRIGNGEKHSDFSFDESDLTYSLTAFYDKHIKAAVDSLK